ncbi:MAG: hypothetical protein ACTSYI_09265 [Promethearchaeota archaeon]
MATENDIVNKNDSIVRRTLWNSYSRRCFYDGDPILYKNLQIDHLIAESTPSDEVARIRKIASLPKNFDLNSFYNLVPTDFLCNNRKRAKNFKDITLAFFLNETQKKYPLLIKNFIKNKKEDTLSEIHSLIESTSGNMESSTNILKYIADYATTALQKEKIKEIISSLQISPSFDAWENEQIMRFFEQFEALVNDLLKYDKCFAHYENPYKLYNIGIILNKSLTNQDGLNFGIVYVPKKNKYFVREIEQGFHPFFLENWVVSGSRYHVMNNPLFSTPVEFAKEIFSESISELLTQNLIIDIQDENLLIEYIFDFVDEFNECLGLDVKDTYDIKHLHLSFFHYFPYWLDTAVNLEEFVTSTTECTIEQTIITNSPTCLPM